MRNAVLIAGSCLGAVAAAVVVWAAVGGNGGGRTAALVEPTQSGSIGELTINGVNGATALPVRSFYWHANRSGSGSVQYWPLEVLREGDEVSPAIFSFSTGVTTSEAFVDLQAPEGGVPYLRYQLTNARLAEYRGGKHEKLALSYLPNGQVDLRVGGGRWPVPDPSEVIGYMSLPGEERVPILSFDAGITPSAHVFDHAVIRRPLDRLARTLKAHLVANTSLGIVTIELKTSAESEAHVTYQLENGVKVVGLSDSAAAGGIATEEVELTFRRMRVSRGGNSACYDASTNSNTC